MTRKFVASFGLLLLASSAASQQLLQSYTGVTPASYFGRSVAIVGDINGDGFDDVLVGAPDEEPSPGGTSPQGKARLYSGKDGSVLRTYTSSALAFEFGYSVAGAGDVNADGILDVIVADYDDVTTTLGGGIVRVFSGSDGAILHSFHGADYDALGFSVAGAGDINLDGFADVLAGAPQFFEFIFNPEIGYARIYSGKDGATLYTFVGGGAPKHVHFGTSVSGLGDVDLDGYPDVLAGAYSGAYAATVPSYVNVYSGKTGLRIRHYAQEFVGFGESVSGTGDADGDGVVDYLIAGTPNNTTVPGKALAYSGLSGAKLYTWSEGVASEVFGAHVAGAGDVNGDGRADFLVTAPGGVTGYVHAFSGKDGTSLYTLPSVVLDTVFGGSIAGGGDVNKDGYADFVVGSYGPANNHGPGSAYVFSGVCQGLTPFGAASTGCSLTQHLNASALPLVGNSAFALTGDHAPASSIGLAILGDVASTIGMDPLGLGVTFHLDLFGSSQLYGLDFVSDAQGIASSPAPIPAIPSLQGVSLFGQALWQGGAACGLPPFGLITSNGLQVTIL